MKLPFGLPQRYGNKARQQNESRELIAFYERKLSEYSDALMKSDQCTTKNIEKLEEYHNSFKDTQLSNVQMALDMTYLKEQDDRLIDLIQHIRTDSEHVEEGLESITAILKKVEGNVEGLDKNAVNRLSELYLELHKQSLEQNRQLQSELTINIDRLNKRVKRGNILLGLFMTGSLLACGVVAFLVLYYLELLPF